MRTAAKLAAMAIALLALGADEPAAPTTAASRPAWETRVLLKGALRYPMPPTWKETGRGADDRVVAFASEDGKTLASITVVPQPQGAAVVNDAMKRQMAEAIGKSYRATAIQMRAEVLQAPRVVPDDAMTLKVTDLLRVPGEEGGTTFRLNAYRIVGTYLVNVYVASKREAQGDRDADQAMAERLLLEMVTAKGAAAQRAVGGAVGGERPVDVRKPVNLRKARLTLTPPLGWHGSFSDVEQGAVAVFSDPADARRRIVVTLYALPYEQRNPAGIRQIIDDSLGAQWGALGVEPAGEPESATDSRFVHRVRLAGGKGEGAWVADVRQVRVGDDRLVSVAMVSPELLADDSAAVADALAVGIGGIGPASRPASRPVVPLGR